MGYLQICCSAEFLRLDMRAIGNKRKGWNRLLFPLSQSSLEVARAGLYFQKRYDKQSKGPVP
ncbi:MAG: hypothetical protein ACJA0F_000234 [Dinoroseobacter sp.]|jgi:hypothetical protein